MTLPSKGKQCPLCGGEIDRDAREYTLNHSIGQLHYGAQMTLHRGSDKQIEVTWRCSSGCEIRVAGQYPEEQYAPEEECLELDVDVFLGVGKEVQGGTSLIDERTKGEFRNEGELCDKADRARVALQELSDD